MSDREADIIDAVATMLHTTGIPVYYEELPRSVVPDVETNTLPQVAVVSEGGDARSAGSDSYVKVRRARADLRCYGRTMQEAKETYLTLAPRLKALRATTVIVGPTGAKVGVRLHNALLFAGPTQMEDVESHWPYYISTWGVHGSEVEIEPGGMFSPMFSDMFA